MTARELKKKYLDFFEKKGHTIIPSAPLVPEHDPTVLFTTAGMHPLVPFLLGESHPAGKRLANIQKSFRTDDIDDVGDPWHNTFFEMLGNWSLGEYWKMQAIGWSFEFLTKELRLDPKRIYVTVFGGDRDIPGVAKDAESIEIWKSLGIAESKIYKLGKKDNWWGPVGLTGPCGPDTEMFYDTGAAEHGENCQPGETCGKYAEIWNDVFMEFNKTANGKYEPLKQKNVDTGMGVERTTAILQGKDNVYDTELFRPIMDKIRVLAQNWNVRSARIIADHLRAAVFLISDDVTPSNVERGYVLRRLIRRAIRYGKLLDIDKNFMKEISESVVEIYKDDWPDLKNRIPIFSQLEQEEDRFRKALEEGLRKSESIFNKKISIPKEKYQKIMQTADKKEIFRQIYRLKGSGDTSAGLGFGIKITKDEIAKATVSGKEAFDLYQTHGFPIEMIIELVQEKGLLVDIEDFESEAKKHQEVSKAGQKKKFAGGLADHSDITVRGHTATHLLHQALRDVLGDHVHQTGSNITPERIRFDFSHSDKLTPEQIKKVETIVNSKIREDLPVKKELMSQEEADKSGAIGLFREKYGDKVSIYKIGDYSIEYCGGPHVKHTGEVGRVKIIKEEALGAGQRRIRATL
ncbi:MAG: alanine--tRNA ligase-related protein [Candidatus Woykebacteria bacterium]